MENSKRPVQVVRSSGLSASLFRNEADKGSPFYKVTLQKTYKEGGTFKTTQSLSRDDLPTAALLLQQAWKEIIDAENANAS